MTNLFQRIFTGLILIIVIFCSIIYGPFSFILLMVVINVLGLLEFYRLFNSYTLLPRNITGVILSAGILVTCILVTSGKGDWRVLLVNIPLVFGIFITELYLKSNNPFQNLAFVFLGIICITIPLCFFMALAVLPPGPGIYPSGYDPNLVLGYFFILWSNDSWEGSLGGALCAFLIAFFLSGIFPTFSRTEWLSIALIIVVTGTYGDLIKSMMKRSLNVKDSGTILPGHGGILDRFDSLLGSAPFIFCYLSLTGHV
jgi:phosphatidate cytidylyltransferase